MRGYNRTSASVKYALRGVNDQLLRLKTPPLALVRQRRRQTRDRPDVVEWFLILSDGTRSQSLPTSEMYEALDLMYLVLKSIDQRKGEDTR